MSGFFEYGFVVRALVAGVLLGCVCGLLSPWIVLRRLAFSADGLAHASLGGLALGLWWSGGVGVPGVSGYVVSFLYTCGVAVLIAFVSSQARVQADTAVGACYVASFAFGTLLLASSRRGTGHLEHLFFGSILSVTWLDCCGLAGLLVVTAAGSLVCWRWLGAWTFDEELAVVSGAPVRWLRYALALLVAAAVVLAARVVGILVVAALLVLPGAVGTLLAQAPAGWVGWSMVVALSGVLAGLWSADRADLPPGPAIVLWAFGAFVVALGVRRWRGVRRARLGVRS